MSSWICLLLAVCCHVTDGSLSYPRNCTDCITRTWGCRKESRERCQASDNKILEFDFQYKELRCGDVIPLNDSALQIDTDLWCEFPKVAGCGWFGMCSPSITCRNMRRYDLPTIISSMDCPNAASVSNLVTQKCSWHCKHKKPVSRCIISFDPKGKYRMQQKLDKCWIQEKCRHRSMKAKATCKSKNPPADMPKVEVFGSMMLQVKDRHKNFLAQPNLNFALQDAIVRMVPECDFDDMFVQAHSEVPSEQRFANLSRVVKVDFNISVLSDEHGTADERALVAELALQNISDEALLVALNGALSSEGLKLLVQDAQLNVKQVNLNETLQKGPGSEEEFFETMSMMRFYQKHLDEVGSELAELQADLKSQNVKDLPANIREKQSSTEKRLSQILASQEKMSSYVSDAMAKHASNSEAFQEAWNRSQTVARELANAKANLSSTKAELFALQQKRFRAEQEALEALRQQGKLNAKLKANATRLARSVAAAAEDLDDLEADYLEAQHDRTEVQKALQKEIIAHGLTMEELESVEGRTSGILMIFGFIVVSMGIAILALGSALWVCSKRKGADISVMPIAEGASENSVVVGRPVHVAPSSISGSTAKTDDLPTLLTSSSSLGKCMGSPMNKPAEAFK